MTDPEYLSNFVGTYETSAGFKVRIDLEGKVLTTSIPGGPQSYTPKPNISGRFIPKEVSSISITFDMDDTGAVTKALLFDPTGVSEAIRID